MMLTAAEIKLLPSLEVDFLEIYEAYESHKRKEQLMDFDDILKYAWGLLKKYPEMLAFFRTSTPIFIWTKPRTPPRFSLRSLNC